MGADIGARLCEALLLDVIGPCTEALVLLLFSCDGSRCFSAVLRRAEWNSSSDIELEPAVAVEFCPRRFARDSSSF